RLPAPGTGDLSMNVDACLSHRPRPGADLEAAMTALARLVSPDGVGLIACAWSARGLLNLFEAIRHAGMGTDLRLSRCRMEQQDGRWGITDDGIFVRQGIPHLGKSSREDAQAFIQSYQFAGGPRDLDQNELGAYAERFRDGDELLLAEGARPVRKT